MTPASADAGGGARATQVKEVPYACASREAIIVAVIVAIVDDCEVGT
jgi:hypothetical protein